jgi:hypothetical protein
MRVAIVNYINVFNVLLVGGADPNTATVVARCHCSLSQRSTLTASYCVGASAATTSFMHLQSAFKTAAIHARATRQL